MKRNWTYIGTSLIVRMFMLGAAAVSFLHIVETGQRLGLGWQAWTCPALIDGFAVLGMIGRSPKFSAATQRAGLRLMVGAGTVSLAANIYAGHNLGQRLYGLLIVVGFVVSEAYAARLRPAPAPAKTNRKCPAGCTCGKHSKKPATAKKPATRTRTTPQPRRRPVIATA